MVFPTGVVLLAPIQRFIHWPCGAFCNLFATCKYLFIDLPWCVIHHQYATVVWLSPPLRPQSTFRQQPPPKTWQTRPEQHVAGEWGEFICLPHDLKSPSKANNRISSVAFRRLLFRHYVYLHCSQLRGCEKPSKHSSLIPILATVSIAGRVQIWNRAMEMSDNCCSLNSWAVSWSFFLQIFFYPPVQCVSEALKPSYLFNYA